MRVYTNTQFPLLHRLLRKFIQPDGEKHPLVCPPRLYSYMEVIYTLVNIKPDLGDYILIQEQWIWLTNTSM